MSLKLKIFSILVALVLFFLIIELVRRKRLREELSWIWLTAGFFILVTAIFDDIAAFLAELTGIKSPQSIVFFLGIIFLIFLNLQLSIKLSRAYDQIKNLAQKETISEYKINSLAQKLKPATGRKSDANKGDSKKQMG